MPPAGPRAEPPAGCPPAAPADLDARLAALQARGAAQLDPVGWTLARALARRAAVLPTARARAQVRARCADACAACESRCAAAEAALDAESATLRARWPQAEPQIAHLRGAADLRALRALGVQLLSQAMVRPVADLVRRLDAGGDGVPTSPATGAPPSAPSPVHPFELKAVRGSRAVWQRLDRDRRLREARRQLPQRPGPLNSERLILQALQAMQSLSPAYLDAFMAQVDTLAWLERAAAEPDAASTAAAAARVRPGARKRSR